jgi:hypothetical protein
MKPFESAHALPSRENLKVGPIYLESLPTEAGVQRSTISLAGTKRAT